MRAAVVMLVLLCALPARGQGMVVDEPTVRAAIDRELEGVDHGGRLDLALPGDGTATLTYTRPDGKIVGRTIVLPPRPEDAIETLALLAGNLVRDQLPPPVAEAAPPAPPRVAPVAIGLFPPISTDLLYDGPVVHHFSLNAAVGMAHGTRGVTISGAVDVERDVRGLQLSGAVNVAGTVRGVQLAGAVNVAGEVNGLQLSPINVARRGRGVQLGVVNYSEAEDGIAIGVVSIVRHGITELDVSVDSAAIAAVVLRHGRRHFYNLYGLGTTVTPEDSAQLAGLGLGSRVARLGRVEADLSLMCWAVEGHDIVADLSVLNQARLTVALAIGRFALFAGVAANVYVGDNNEDGAALHPALDKSWLSGETTVRLWPTFSLGLRVR